MNDKYHGRRLVVDLDGTLCEQTAGGPAYAAAKPIKEVIEKVNRMYDEGWHVTIHTARGMRTYNGHVGRVKWHLEPMTRAWLQVNGVRYHELIMGKPAGDKYVDDRGVRPDEFINEVL